MKTYATFLEDGIEALGSDAWFQLDGRNNLATHRIDALTRIQKLRFVQPRYNGFQIRRGTKPSSSTVVYTENIR